MSLISIGLSGLNASSAAMTAIGNNTANVDTQGYSRQQVMTTASQQESLGVGFIGTGTTLSDVRRIYNGFLDTQLQTSTSLNSDAQAFLGQASKLDSILSESSTGVSKVLSSFFTSMQALSRSPTDTSLRNAFLKSGQALSSQFNNISAQMKDQTSQINAQLTAVAGQVNSLAASVASLNTQIIQARGTGNEPNTLLDSRDEAVRQLNELVGAKVVQTNGSYDVYIGTGQPLVTGSTANKLSAASSDSDPTNYSLTINYQNSNVDVSSVLTGGSLGGLLRYRSDVLQPAAKELGRMALVVADKVNTQLNQGIDANGNFGASLFNNINDPNLALQRATANVKNNASSGAVGVNITDTGLLDTHDYQMTFSGGAAGANATQYSVKVMPDGTSLGPFNVTDPAPAELTKRGFSLSFVSTDTTTTPTPAATYKNGDSFILSPTRTGADGIKTVMTDSKSLAAAAPLSGNTGTSNKGNGLFGQPVMVTQGNIYDAQGLNDLRNAMSSSMPVRVVLGDAAADGSQPYKLVDAQGKPVLGYSGSATPPAAPTAITGQITQRQSNDLNFQVAYTDSKGNASFYAFSLNVSGQPNSGDTYNIDMTKAGSGDNRNTESVVALQNQQTVNMSGGAGTGMTMAGANANLVSNVGAQAKQASADGAATTAVLGQAKSARDSVSGVSMDEEAANLVKYQQYYTASSQIIKAAQTIFSTLINSL